MFTNEPPLDFSIAANRENFREALRGAEQRIENGGFRSFPIIAGHDFPTTTEIERMDPSDPMVRVGMVSYAGEREVAEALTALRQGKKAWRDTPIEERAAVMRRAAAGLREHSLALSALIVREVGKPWEGAYLDVTEAIDFCEYYAEELLRIATPKLTMDLMGEENHFFYRPRGMSVVISPWNFPIAIACGMTVASLVAGNVTILKPAEQSSLIAYELAKILLDAGVPENAFAFLPGLGEEIGRALVNSPEIDLIAFTGSKAVGLEIIRSAAEPYEGQTRIKRVIAELGGKNAIIVDEDADLDEAIKGIIHSAFNYAGQKCSACSRVIVVGDAYEPFLRRVCLAAEDVIVGEARDPGVLLGPVVDEESYQRLREAIEAAKEENTVAFEGEWISPGYFVPPVIFRDVDTRSSLWRNELFGPVLACSHAKGFEQALELANDSEYALTGGLYSRSPRNIERATRALEVGNLYVNRGCTGAIVGRQPFGGYKMSGVGSKAGGPDYLRQFMEPITVSENTMRRGCAPELA